MLNRKKRKELAAVLEQVWPLITIVMVFVKSLVFSYFPSAVTATSNSVDELSALSTCSNSKVILVKNVEAYSNSNLSQRGATKSETGLFGSNRNPAPSQSGNAGSSGSAGYCNNEGPNPKVAPQLEDQGLSVSAARGRSKKKDNSKTLDYKNVMQQMESQKGKKKVEVTVGDQKYTLDNPYGMGAEELQDILAEKMYQNNRNNKSDVQQISDKSTLNPKNIDICKEHVFMKKHKLDLYVDLGEPVVEARFDPNLNQALAWERFKEGIPTAADTEWLRHEFIEAKYEIKHDCGYSEAHAHAQARFDGNPWKNDDWRK